MMRNQQTWVKEGVFIIILAGLVTIWTSSAIAESDFPVHPVEVIIPYAPGGGMDSVMNAFKDRAGKILGRPIITTFKPGAGGATGIAYLTRSKPDGYTLGVSAFTSHIVFPLTKKDLGYTLV